MPPESCVRLSPRAWSRRSTSHWWKAYCTHRETRFCWTFRWHKRMVRIVSQCVLIGIRDMSIAEANYAQCVPEKGHPYPPKSAVTLVESVHVSSERTLVRLLLHTGRRHQLRVHLSHLNHAIVGDAMYNADRSDSDSRLMLHAHRLVVPLRSCTLQLHAPCPFLPAAVRLDTSGIRVPPMLPPFLTLTSVLDTHVERCTRVLLMPYTTRDQTVTVWLHRQTRRCRHRLVPIRGDHLSPLQCRRSSGHADLCDSAMSLLFEDHEALQHARRVRHSLTQQPLCAETESVRAVRRFPFAVYFVPEQWLEGRKQELQPVDVHLSQLNSRNSQLDVDDIVHLLVKDAFVDNSDNRNIVHCENLPGFHDAERHLCFHFQHAVAHGENTEAACNARLLSQCEKRHFFIDEVNERAAIAHRFRKQAEREEREQNEKQGFARAAKQGVEIIRSIFAARQEKLQTSTPVRSFAQLFCGRKEQLRLWFRAATLFRETRNFALLESSDAAQPLTFSHAIPWLLKPERKFLRRRQDEVYTAKLEECDVLVVNLRCWRRMHPGAVMGDETKLKIQRLLQRVPFGVVVSTESDFAAFETAFAAFALVVRCA
ncbi:MAG: hypothetical protein MHM6MM_000143 [Cercozoa sp. M6MM]